MRISLDYDDTYTRDPKTWLRVVDVLRAAGHDVVCVTMRYAHEPIDPRLVEAVSAVYYTDRWAKQVWCNAYGVRIDVWIDDSPHWIVGNG